MQLGSLALNSETTGGIADDPAFRDAALQAEPGEETDLIELAGGGLATLRVEKIDPPAVIPLAEIRDRVAADWREARTADALQKLAVGYVDRARGRPQPSPTSPSASTARSAAPGRSPAARPPRARRPSSSPTSSPRDGDPVGAPVTRRDRDGVILAEVTAVEAFDPATEANRQILDNLRAQYREQARGDLLALYTAALRDQAGVTVNQPLLESTLARFP